MIDDNRYISGISCIVLIVLFCIAAGCSSSPAPATKTPTQSASSGGNTITIKDFAFDPPVIAIKPGTTITWVNQDTSPHTVVSDTGSPESFSSDPLPNGVTYTRTFTIPGTHSYHCSIHPSMKGTVTVQG